MPNDIFWSRVELKMHMLIILSVASFSLAAVITKNINAAPSGSYCHLSSLPLGCRDNVDVECTRGLQVIPLVLVYMLTSFLCLLGIILTMTMMSWHVIFQERMLYGLRSRKYSEQSHCAPCSCLQMFQERKEDETQAIYLARLYLGQVVLQACLYVAGYLLTYTFIWVQSAYYLSGLNPPEWILILISLVYPGSGLFNILVYTRPKVSSFRMRHPEYNWLHALWLVVKAGGEIPSDEVLNARSTNNRNDHDQDQVDCTCCWGVFQVNLDRYDISQLSCSSTIGNREINPRDHVNSLVAADNEYLDNDDLFSNASPIMLLTDSNSQKMVEVSVEERVEFSAGEGNCSSGKSFSLNIINEETNDDLQSIVSHDQSAKVVFPIPSSMNTEIPAF
jgi:hypothetical protein